MHEHGYKLMPPVEETLASYLLLGEAPTLPTKALRETSRLNGRAYAATGQAGAALHTVVVLQAYQANLLKDLDQGQGLPSKAIAQLRHTTDLALHTTKQTAATIGRSMAAMMAMERHLWVKTSGRNRKKCAGFAI